MARYICILSAPDGAPPLSDETIDAHREYLRRLFNEGTLVAAGPLSNPPGGLLVFEADSDAIAQAVVDNDPAIADGGQHGHLREWTVAFGG